MALKFDSRRFPTWQCQAWNAVKGGRGKIFSLRVANNAPAPFDFACDSTRSRLSSEELIYRRQLAEQIYSSFVLRKSGNWDIAVTFESTIFTTFQLFSRIVRKRNRLCLNVEKLCFASTHADSEIRDWLRSYFRRILLRHEWEVNKHRVTTSGRSRTAFE